eukprot:1373975-Amorphochlora_amoeboformis.AAC.1
MLPSLGADGSARWRRRDCGGVGGGLVEGGVLARLMTRKPMITNAAPPSDARLGSMPCCFVID